MVLCEGNQVVETLAASRTARTPLHLCSVTLISLMRGSVTNQPK